MLIKEMNQNLIIDTFCMLCLFVANNHFQNLEEREKKRGGGGNRRGESN